jgi:hypothetical protein
MISPRVDVLPPGVLLVGGKQRQQRLGVILDEPLCAVCLPVNEQPSVRVDRPEEADEGVDISEVYRPIARSIRT